MAEEQQREHEQKQSSHMASATKIPIPVDYHSVGVGMMNPYGEKGTLLHYAQPYASQFSQPVVGRDYIPHPYTPPMAIGSSVQVPGGPPVCESEKMVSNRMMPSQHMIPMDPMHMRGYPYPVHHIGMSPTMDATHPAMPFCYPSFSHPAMHPSYEYWSCHRPPMPVLSPQSGNSGTLSSNGPVMPNHGHTVSGKRPRSSSCDNFDDAKFGRDEDSKSGGKTKKKSKYRGVFWHSRGKAWVSSIMVNGKTTHLGYYDCEVEAARVYDKEAIRLKGITCAVNFPDSIEKFGGAKVAQPNGGAKVAQPEQTEKSGSTRHERKRAERVSKYRGVCWNKCNSSWKACIKIDGKNKHIGYFTDEIEAAKAYDAKALEVRGPDAKLNFPEAAQSAK